MVLFTRKNYLYPNPFGTVTFVTFWCAQDASICYTESLKNNLTGQGGKSLHLRTVSLKINLVSQGLFYVPLYKFEPK